MKTNILTNIRVWAIMMACLTVLGVGNAWGVDVTFTFNSDAGIAALGISKPSSSSGTSLDTSNPYVLSGVSMAVTHGSTNTRVWNSGGTLDLRVYSSAGSLTFTAPGNITDVLISGTTVNGFSANVGTYTTSTGAWSGNAASVTFTAGATQKVNTIKVTYTASDPYTVNFNAQGGTCGTASLTEASGGAGVTLPAASPTAACASEGWAFYGWATAQCASSTPTAPAIVGKAGDTYHPLADNTTLHAVYATGEYTKETSAITSGAKYLIVANSTKNYVMTDSYSLNGSEGEMASVQIDETSSNKYHAAAVNANWCYTIEGTAGHYYIRDVKNNSNANYIDIAYQDWYGKGEDSDDQFTITVSNPNWTLQGNYNHKEGWAHEDLAFDGSNKVFKRGAGTVLLYKQTTTPAYWSNPSCCANAVAVSYNSAGSSHVSAMTFSAANVATCSATDADRQLTIYVTPTSGYLMKTGDRLTYTGDGTATYVSGPTLNAGKYEFVYRFGQNNNGSGTFAATTSTLTNYRTICCVELGAITSSISLSNAGNNVTASGWGATSGGNETGYLVRLYNSDKSAVITSGNTGSKATKTYTFSNPGAGTYWVSVTPTYSGAGNYCEAGEETFSASSVTITGNVTVTFDATTNGGSISTSTQSVPHNESTALTSWSTLGGSAPSCKQFAHWNTEADDSGESYADGASITATGAVTLYAIYSTNTYTISDGTMTGVASHSYSANPINCGTTLTITCAADASHKGNPTVTATGTHGAITVVSATSVTIANVTSAITVNISYAAKENYTVTLNPGNGTLSAGNSWAASSTNLTQTVMEGNATTAMPDPTPGCSGWSFVGWKAGSAADNQASFTPDKTSGATVSPNANITYYAVYRQSASGGTTYNKITSIGDLTTGNYVIKTASHAMTNARAWYSSGGYYYMTETYNTNSGASLTNDNANITWTIVKFGSNYAIKNGSNFVGIDSDGLLVYDTDIHLFTAAYDGTLNGWVFTSTESTDQLVYNYYFRSLDEQSTAILLYKQGAGAGTGNYFSSPSCSDYTITGVADPVAGGTVTLSASSAKTGEVVYAYYTKDPVYNFVNWTKTGEGATLSSTTDQLTELTVGTENVTLTANFAAIVYRSITWKNNDVELTALERGSASTSVEDGQKVSAIPVALASGADGKSCDKDNYPVFRGWTASPIAGVSGSAPLDLFSDAASAPTVSGGNATYHAVWADSGPAEKTVSRSTCQTSNTYVDGTGVDHNITISWQKGNAATAPYNATNAVRLYQASNSSTYGGYVTVSAASGCKIKSVTFTISGTYKTYVKYSTGTPSSGPTAPASAAVIEKNDSYTVNNLDATQFTLYQYDDDSDYRLEVQGISVTYSSGTPATGYITKCTCSDFSFHYGTRTQSDWNAEPLCFEESTDGDGNTGHYWYLKDFELPDKPHYYVGWQGSWNTTDAKSADANFENMVFGLLRQNSCSYQALGTYSDGNSIGAVGTLRIRDSYGDANRYIDFIPDGYVLRIGTDTPSPVWTSTALTRISNSLTETVFESEMVTLNASTQITGKNFWVGLKTSDSFVWNSTVSESRAMTTMGVTSGKDAYDNITWRATSLGAGDDGQKGKFRIWADNCNKNWNCHFVPYYHLSYDGNGGGDVVTNVPEASADKSCEGDNSARTVQVSTTVPAREGYTFIGWNTQAGGGGTSKSAGDNVVLTSDVTLYAQWRQNFTVTYDLGGGSAIPACAGGTYYVGQTVDVCGSTPTRLSSSFTGWLVYKTGDKSTTVTVTAGQFTMPTYNVTVEAQYETVYWHITYHDESDANIGGISSDKKDVPQGLEITLPSMSPCPGYTFYGWSTSKYAVETTNKGTVDGTLIGKGGASYTPTADITVYPVYKRVEGYVQKKDTLTVTSLGISGNSYVVYSDKTLRSSAVYSIKVASSDGMQFKANGGDNSGLVTTTSGGALEKIAVHIPYAASYSYHVYTYTSTTAYALSEVPSTIHGTQTWDLNHATKSPSGGRWYEHDYSSDVYTTFGMYASATHKADSIIVTWGTGTAYYATHCELRENVTITYNGNGGTVGCGSPADGTVTTVTWDYADGGMRAPTLASSQTICNSATRAGYLFNRWNTAADGTGRDYAGGATVTQFGGDSTLYAIWDRIYTVTLHDNGVLRTTLTQESAGDPVDLPTGNNCMPSSEFTFIGWTESAVELNADPVRPAAATLHAAGSYTPTSDITLYSVYSRSVAGCEDFAAGVSGAYKMYNNTSGDYAKVTANSNRYDKGSSGDAEIFYIAYAPAHTAYTIRTSLGYLGWEGAVGSENLTKTNTTPYYWNITTNGTNWNFQPVGVSGKQFSGNGTYFNLHSNSTKYYIRLEKVAMTYYYNTALCGDAKITFHDGGGSISGTPTTPTGASWNSTTHVLSGLEDCDKITTFPTASYDGWTFVGWSTEDYTNSGKHTEGTSQYAAENASTDEPDGSEIYKTDGNPYVVRGGSIDLYPVFTRFPENEPFNMEEGGTFYMYYLDPNSDDGYGAPARRYAGAWDGTKRYTATTNCANATEFEFTKSGDVWHIKNTANNKWVGGKSNDDWLIENNSLGTLTDWTITIRSGNQFNATCQSDRQISVYQNFFMDYASENIGKIPGYHAVYLGSCEERIFSSEPHAVPTIDLTGEPYVTSSNGETVRATATMTLSASHLGSVPANKVIVSGGTGLKFATTASANPSNTVSLNLTDGKLAATTIYVYYTPTATEDGLENIIVTAKAYNGSSPKDLQTTGTVHCRHIPADFVIAAKWEGKWYALPNTCTFDGSSTAGVLITVDNDNDPTSATYAPSTTKWGMRETKKGSRTDGSYNDRLVFTERGTTSTANSQQALYNYNSAEVYTNATYTNYNNTNPERYEWIPVSSDFKDYTLTNAEANKPLILRNDCEFKAQTTNQAYDGKVRLLPATFYEDNVQIIEWKTSSVVIMYTGTQTSATTTVGTNSASSAQTLSTHKLTHGIYELTTAQALTSNAGKNLVLTFGSDASKKIFEIPIIINGSPTASDGHAKQDVVIVSGGKLQASSTDYHYRNIYVYGGGKLHIPDGTTLSVNNIILRAGGISTSGIGSSPTATYQYVYPQVYLKGTLNSTKTDIKYEYITDYDHWFHLCLPFDATLNSIHYPVEYYGQNVKENNKGSWIIKRYDGATRATGNYAAWVDIESESAIVASAGHGYIFWGAPKNLTIGGDKQRQKWGIQRMTMSTTAAAAKTAENANKTIDGLSSYSGVTGNSGKVNDQGWNLIGNPYLVGLSELNSESLKPGKLVHEESGGQWTGHWEDNEDGVRYVTIPDDHFNNYEARPMSWFTTSNLMVAGRTFFVQIDGDATGVTFLTAKRKTLLPALYAQKEASTSVETGIVMSDETKHDEVNFWIKDGKTEAYESNADYPKTPNGSNFNIYGVHEACDLSWIAISPEIAEGSMAIGYQVPTAGEYRLSLSETYVSDKIEHMFVTDHAMNPEVTVDLMDGSYEFMVNQAETNNERFTVSIKLKDASPGILTGVESLDWKSEQPQKFIWQDKMYILRGGVIYDATGKKVREIK